MPQSRESGAKANRFGHLAATAIGSAIGARKVSVRGNEFEYKGQRVTIRTARSNTTIVGVLYSMLDRIQLVIAAFETQPGEFELISLTPKIFRENMRDSKTGNGRVGLVHKKVFTEFGTRMGIIATPDIDF